MFEHLGGRAFRGALIIVMSFSFIAALQGRARAQAGNAAVLPLVVSGADIPALVGLDPAGLSVFSCKSGKPKPILFQVDELNDAGRVVSRYGDTGRVEADNTPGRIDANDELLLMLRELGPACADADVAKLRGTVIPIRAEADYLAGPVFAYAVSSGRGYVPGGQYLAYDAATHTVKCAGYLWGYEPERPFFYDRLGYGELRGREFEDVFDRVKARFQVRALGSLVRINMTEDDMESTMDGVRVGPVRVTREVTVRVAVVPGLTVIAYATFQHYERYRLARVRLNFPAQAALFTSSIQVQFVHDFTDMKGTRFLTQAVPEGALVDGSMAEFEKDMRYGEKVWSLFTGLGVNEMLIMHYDPSLNLTPAQYFLDSESESVPPESVPGALPAAGFQFIDWQDLEAKQYEFGVSMFALPSFPEGGGNGFYDVFAAPIRISSGREQAAR